MNEDFVTYEVAKKLKDKGYKELCFGYYTNNDILYLNFSHKAGTNYSGCLLSHNSMPEDSVSGKFVDAPTISQVLKWLRKGKKISIEIAIHCSLKWMCSIYGFSDGITDYTQYNNDGVNDTVYILYDSYESAAIAGIEYVLDNLI